MAVKGTLCAIVCPALEDELIFALENDADEKKVYVVNNNDTSTLLRKMDQRSMEYEMMEEYRIRTSLDVDPDAYNVVIIMNGMRLHKEPLELKKYLEDQLIMLNNKFDAIAMYYGMCGNFGWDITEWAKENLDTPVTIFHDGEGCVCDDCIGVAVGGRKEYIQLVHDYTGMLFLTPAVATNWDEHVVFEDSKEWDQFYPSRDAYMKDLFKWGNYEYALKIDTGLGDREKYDSMCEDVVNRMDLKIKLPNEPIATTKLATDIYERSKALLKKSD